MAVRIATTGAATFTATGDWGNSATPSSPAPPTFVRVWLAGYFVGEDDIAAPERLENGDSYTVPVGTRYNWTMTPDGGAAGDSDDGLAALMNAGAGTVVLAFSLHTAAFDNGPATANELTPADYPGYARQTAGFTVSAG